MGCCISSSSNDTNDTSKPQPQPQPQDPHFLNRALVPESDTPDLGRPISGKSAAPPLPLVEEETVKEVLSETPTPKPPPLATTTFSKQQQQQEQQQKPLKKVPSFPKIQEQEQEKKNTHFEKPLEEDISEESELYSLTESAISTSAVTDRREDDGSEVTQRVLVEPTPSKKIPRKRSTSGDLAAGRGGKSPARRSPARKTSREMGQTARRRILPQNGISRDPGETSCRRSRSPSTTRMEAGVSGRVAGGCQSPMRLHRSSPGRIPASSSENRRVVEEDDERREENWATKESLEDPLVSLECFIFL